MAPRDDQVLLTKIAKGDQAALEQLYAAYRLRLWTYLWHELDGSPHWIEEVLQDVFLAVWRSASSYRGEAQVATWLFEIARRLAMNARRERNRRAEGHLLNLSDTLDEKQSHTVYQNRSYEDQVLERITLVHALQQLSPKHQEVLDLVFYHGFSYDEVAHILAVPSGTVKSRINYARRMLLQKLNEAKAAEEVDCDR